MENKQVYVTYFILVIMPKWPSGPRFAILSPMPLSSDQPAIGLIQVKSVISYHPYVLHVESFKSRFQKDAFSTATRTLIIYIAYMVYMLYQNFTFSQARDMK